MNDPERDPALNNAHEQLPAEAADQLDAALVRYGELVPFADLSDEQRAEIGLKVKETLEDGFEDPLQLEIDGNFSVEEAHSLAFTDAVTDRYLQLAELKVTHENPNTDLAFEIATIDLGLDLGEVSKIITGNENFDVQDKDAVIGNIIGVSSALQESISLFERVENVAHDIGGLAAEAALRLDDADTQPLPTNNEEQRPQPDHIQSWDELKDPRNAIRFMRGMQTQNAKKIGKDKVTTKDILNIWGIGPTSDSHALATYFGLSEEQWRHELEDVIPYINVSYPDWIVKKHELEQEGNIPAEKIEKIDALKIFNFNLRNKFLETYVRGAYPDEVQSKTLDDGRKVIDSDSFGEFQVETIYDHYEQISISELDEIIHQTEDATDKRELIINYLLPRADGQEARLAMGMLSEDQVAQADAIIGEVRASLKGLGIRRLGKSEIEGKQYNPGIHEQRGETVGNGYLRVVDEELRAGYAQVQGEGNDQKIVPFRPARVRVRKK